MSFVVGRLIKAVWIVPTSGFVHVNVCNNSQSILSWQLRLTEYRFKWFQWLSETNGQKFSRKISEIGIDRLQNL